MNILVVIGSLNYGGAEKQAVQDANLLAKTHCVWLVCFQKGPLFDSLNKTVHFISIKERNYLLRAWTLSKIIKKNKIDIVHASLFAAMISSGISRLLARFRLFWHFHSHEYQMPFFIRILFQRLGISFLIEKMLFVNNELLIFYKSRFHFPSHKLGVLYNCTIPSDSISGKEINEFVTIGYTGRLVELKRVEYLLELAEFLISKTFNSFKILIVGDGEQRVPLESKIKELGLGRYFKFTGFQKDTSYWYNQMEIFTLPSKEECLSMVTIDAGAHGIPAVAFDVGGNSEIIMHGETGYIVNSKEEFFQRIYQLAINIELRKSLGKSGMLHCRYKFGEEKHLKDIYQLYNID